MSNIIDWVIAHWADIANVIAYAVAAASMIVKMTPTLKDDNILLPIIKFLGKFIALDKYGPASRPK